MFRIALVACFFVLSLLATQLACADELTEFELARNSYTGARYEEAIERFSKILDTQRPRRLLNPQLIEQARIYRVASLLALSRLQEADAEIEVILRINPGAYPDPVIFPGVVLDHFTDVRGRIRKQLEDQARRRSELERLRLQQQQDRERREQLRVQKLEEVAKQQVHIVENSRWIAAIPFGVGQFQNRQSIAGWAFLVSESLLATTSIITAAVHFDLQSKGTQPNVDTKDLNERLARLKLVNNISFGTFAVIAAAGILHAQLVFKPFHEEIRQRELPGELKPLPTVSVTTDKVTIGLEGVF